MLSLKRMNEPTKKGRENIMNNIWKEDKRSASRTKT